MSARDGSRLSTLEIMKLNAFERLIDLVKESEELCALCREIHADLFDSIIERRPYKCQDYDMDIKRYEFFKVMITIAKEHRAIRQEFPARVTGQFTKPASRDY